jgi:ATP-dependent Clp protease ATP-binding subunit ClpC
MYERFTDRARKVMQFANQEAHRLNHEYIGTEHIILGLIKEGSGVAVRALKKFDLDLPEIRKAVQDLIKSGPEEIITMGRLPHTPRAKMVIDYAMNESQKLLHNYVGTEHLLLGLLREEEGVAALVLKSKDITVESARKAVSEVLRDEERELSGGLAERKTSRGLLRFARAVMTEVDCPEELIPELCESPKNSSGYGFLKNRYWPISF